MKNHIVSRILIFILSLYSGLFVFAVLPAQEPSGFKPGGKPEVRIFSSLSTAFADGENHSKFDLTRAYFGYNYNFSPKLTGRIVYDVADPSAGKLKFTGMLKFAYLRYQTGKWTISGGMIPLPEYDISDKKWGFRYVFNPLHSEYGFGTAADLGLSVAYNIAPWLSADVTLMNGEGFKLAEADSTFKSAAGITMMPLKGFSLRGYYDNMTKNSVSQHTFEIIAAFESRKFVLSTAWNFRTNQGFVREKNYHGLSFNGTALLRERIKIFGRYDYVTSDIVGSEPDPWNISKDGQLILGGFDIMLAPGVNLSPNYQGWKPAAAGMPFISRFFLSIDLKI